MSKKTKASSASKTSVKEQIVPKNRFDLLGGNNEDSDESSDEIQVHNKINSNVENDQDNDSDNSNDSNEVTDADSDEFTVVKNKSKQTKAKSTDKKLVKNTRKILTKNSPTSVKAVKSNNDVIKETKKPIVETKSIKTEKYQDESSSNESSDDSDKIDQSSQSNQSNQTDQVKKYVPPSVSDNDWVPVGQKKRRNKYDEDEVETIEVEKYRPGIKLPGDDMKLNTVWKMWAHENSNPDWSLDSYNLIYSISSVGEMWRLLNNFSNLDKSVRQYYIMRDGITPIWEDNNNKQGAICSIMVDNINKSTSQSGGDLGVGTFGAILILVLNESFVKNNTIINGLCYSIKSRSVLIKLWIKDGEANKNFRETLPLPILNHVDMILSNVDTRGYYRSNKSKISIQLKPIKPNY